MVYKLITAPTEPAITVEEAKAQLHIDTSFTDDDVFLASAIQSAGLLIEKLIQHPLMAQVWELQANTFVQCFELYKVPVAESPALTLKYSDGANAEQTVNAANYQVDLASEPSRVILNSSFAVPTVYDRFDAVRLRFTAGYANAAAVPEDLKTWVKILVTEFYEYRDFSVKPETMVAIERALMRHALWL